MSARTWLREQLPRYRTESLKPKPVNDQIVHHVFRSYANLEDPTDVQARISVLNGFYRANLFDVETMGVYISRLAQRRRLKAMLENGNDRAIDLIREGHGIRKNGRGADENFYVFATKFAIWHELARYSNYSNATTHFAMFDSRVETALKHLSPALLLWGGDEVKVILERLPDIRNLPNQHLRDILDLVLKVTEAKGLTRYKGLDEALWALGYDLEAQRSERYIEEIPRWLLGGKQPRD